MARDLKFRIKIEEGSHYPCSENKGADQLSGYREADLSLCFRICKKPVFSRRGSYEFYQIVIVSCKKVIADPYLRVPLKWMHVSHLKAALLDVHVPPKFTLCMHSNVNYKNVKYSK